MSEMRVIDIVCDYGLEIDGELKLICNSKWNALLIKAIMEKDSCCNKSDYIFDSNEFVKFIEKIENGVLS